ncbi:dihydroxy-acid dehydratase [Caulobacter segnis]
MTSAINDPALNIDESCILVIRGAGPIGWPGSAEVVEHAPPDHLLKKGIMSLPTLGDGRQSGTADSPSILNALAGKRCRRRPVAAAHRRHDPLASTSTPAAATPWWTRRRSPNARRKACRPSPPP